MNVVIFHLLFLLADIGLFAGLVWAFGWLMTAAVTFSLLLAFTTYYCGFRAFAVGHA